MKYKSIKLIAFFLVLGGAFTACKKDTLFGNPTNALSDADAYNSPDRIEKNSVGMYDALQNANYFGGRVLIYADQRGLDATPNTFFGNMGFFNTTTASDGTVAGAYQGAYRTIYQANLFLKNFLPKASVVTTAKADQYVGEAKFIRSLCYFYLVNLWGQTYTHTADASHLGVPLVLTATDDPFDISNAIPRSTVKQVYDQMEADLLEAETKLPVNVGTDAFNRTARASKGAARALLCRLYLYKGDYAKAIQYADAVIGMGTYSLNPNLTTTFQPPYTTNESIFSVAMNGGDNPNTNNSLGQHYGSQPGRGDISVTSDYIALMNTAVDKRYTTLIKTVGGLQWTLKYPGLTTDFVPVLRYAEILLNKAEALARSNAGVNATALALVQQVRDRSTGGTIVVTTQAELIAAIVKERRIELAFEGHGIMDLNRWKMDIPVHAGGLVPAQPYGGNYRALPIPKYETDKNSSLVQNPGY